MSEECTAYGWTWAEAAWVAGLLEGEGCFSIFTRSSSTHNHKSLAIHCEMTDEDVIHKLHKICGCGTVNKRANTNGRVDRRERKPTWIWSVQNHAGILEVCETIYPMMGQRRQQKIKEMIEYVTSKTRMGNTRGRKDNSVLCSCQQPCKSTQ